MGKWESGGAGSRQPGHTILGVRRDISRTLVVIAEQPQLWGAIRDRLDPSLALVRNARPGQLADVWSRADPWPWLVVGAAREVPEPLGALVAGRPVPVLEDEPEQLRRLGEAVGSTGLVPLLAEHPRKALAMLDFHRPVLAILDLDMSKAERTGRTVEEVLERLYERHGVCIPIVYSVNVGTVERRDWIAGLHPYALVQDK